MELQGKVALVTGATRGIGRAIADKLLQHGACVAVCGRNEQLLAEYTGDNVLPVRADVTDGSDVDAMVKTVLNEFGRIDILVNNAGITKDSLLMRMDDQQWEQVLTTNLTGAFFACRAVVRTMLKQRSGRIINISSIIGVTGNAGQTNYAASKAGLIGFGKSLAKEVANRGILVNTIAPGYIESDMTKGLSEKLKAQVVAKIPLGHTGAAEDVAEAVLFLASDRNRYITGQTLHVDGGLVI